MKFYFVGFKKLDNVKKALRSYEIEDLKDKKAVASLSLAAMPGNFLFINTSSESTLPPNELDNILKDLEKNVGVAVTIVGKDADSISTKRKGTLFVEVKESGDPDLEVAKVIQKIRNALDRFAGNSSYTRNLKREIISFTFFDPNVLILGETGTGKTLLAHIVHDVVIKRKKMIFLNSATIPISLMESELFGHAKGSYTSADSTKEGLIAKADGGHMFFDEIAELPLHIQAKLLHVVEEGTYNMVGDPTMRKVDVRFISATNRDVNYLRKDLFFRMSERVIQIPPLRQRKEDIPDIVNHIFKSNGYDFKFEDMPQDSQHILMNYSYPGNIRELQNFVKQFISEGRIKAPVEMIEKEKSKSGTSSPNEVDSTSKANVVDGMLNMIENIMKSGELPPYASLKECIEDQLNIVYLSKVLQMFKWDKHEVANRLGISYRYLNKLISKYGIDRRVKKSNA